MARNNTNTTQERDQSDRAQGRRPAQSTNGQARHEHRTAKVVELIGTSTRGFEDAVKAAIADASATTRNITGAQVEGWSVKCADGKITEYKASIKVAFGIERT